MAPLWAQEVPALRKRILLMIIALPPLVLVALATGVGWAHLAICRERAPLPSAEEVLASASGEDRPVSISWINTASQAMPRSAVLDPKRDAFPGRPYVMSHPAFVLEWSDGRLLLIDTGMDRERALAFGKQIERLGGAQPIVPLHSVAERLGPARARVAGLVFTHLHVDHVEGLGALCAGIPHPVPVFMTVAQHERSNYSTRPGRWLLEEAACAKPVALQGGPLLELEGFPGVFLIAAGGHTPGSQIVIAHVREGEKLQTYAMTGDVVNQIDGINDDLPKPFLYSLVVVPEDGERLRELRRYLRELRDRAGVVLLVSHDQAELEASGVAQRE
ncbi:MAG TPA: MBL fold metallo-hydrolase [Myxococcota bacterium]|nr:MBL fold metallo-hydrolase [Myxococcota bacterium]